MQSAIGVSNAESVSSGLDGDVLGGLSSGEDSEDEEGRIYDLHQVIIGRSRHPNACQLSEIKESTGSTILGRHQVDPPPQQAEEILPFGPIFPISPEQVLVWQVKDHQHHSPRDGYAQQDVQNSMISGAAAGEEGHDGLGARDPEDHESYIEGDASQAVEDKVGHRRDVVRTYEEDRR